MPHQRRPGWPLRAGSACTLWRRQSKQRRQGFSVLRMPQRIRVVMRAALNQNKALGLRCQRVKCATQIGVNELVLAAMHHQHRGLHPGDAFGRIEGLGDQRPQRQPTPFEGAQHIGNRGEAAFNHQPGQLGIALSQLHRHRAAQRMAEDIAARRRVLLAQPIPGRMYE